MQDERAEIEKEREEMQDKFENIEKRLEFTKN